MQRKGVVGLAAALLMAKGAAGRIGEKPMEPRKDELFVATPLTQASSFTEGIEGPNCDAQGNVYAVNFGRQGTIGKVTPEGHGEVFVELPNGSIGNGIVFDRAALMYVADYVKHNVLRIDPRTRAVTIFAHEDSMNQPNDLAIGPDETLYASDPNWKESTGQLWRIDPDGRVTRVVTGMGTTNGIEVSPDGKTLYVNESVQRNVWAFTITPDHTLTNKRLLIQFPDHGFDGMRCDVDGNLYITRYGKGTVVKVSPEGKVLREIAVLGARPSNLCFGGPGGRTIYVTEVEHHVDRPGLAAVASGAGCGAGFAPAVETAAEATQGPHPPCGYPAPTPRTGGCQPRSQTLSGPSDTSRQ